MHANCLVLITSVCVVWCACVGVQHASGEQQEKETGKNVQILLNFDDTVLPESQECTRKYTHIYHNAKAGFWHMHVYIM